MRPDHHMKDHHDHKRLTDYEALHKLIRDNNIHDRAVSGLHDKLEHEIARLFDIHYKRVSLDVKCNEITFDVSHNRHVYFSLGRLYELQRLTGAVDIILFSPIRCKIVAKLKMKHDKPFYNNKRGVIGG